MKTGVLTFHRCINYGSYWQARCLTEGLRARGHDAVLLDHVSATVNRAEWRCGFQPTLPTPVPASDRPQYREKMRRFFEAFEGLPLSAPFPLDDPSRLEELDAVVVGSDEVWNLSHPWYGGKPLFWGEGLRARKLISYAASFGCYGWQWGLEPQWVERLRRFDAIAVRDVNSVTHIREALDVEPALTLDPCLQFPLPPEGPWQGPSEPFALVYGHNFSEGFQRQVRRWAGERGLPLLSIGYRSDWADRQWIEAGPQDFAHAMQRAAAVATNFFHGCVFAINNRRPFACEATDYRAFKVRGLMALLGAEDRMVVEGTTSEAVDSLLCEPPPAAVHARISALRAASDAYLHGAGV